MEIVIVIEGNENIEGVLINCSTHTSRSRALHIYRHIRAVKDLADEVGGECGHAWSRNDGTGLERPHGDLYAGLLRPLNLTSVESL